MKKNLTKTENVIYHFVDGKKVMGVHSNISGNVYGIRGNIDTCDISEEERKKGIDIKDLLNN